jgi:NTE family protein
MLGVNLQNTTSDSFGVSLSARYLTFDVPFSGSELRLDGTIGSNPVRGAEWYQPLGRTPLFIAPYAGVGQSAYSLVENDAVVARYDQTYLKAGLNIGVNLGAFSDLRVGAYIGRLDATVAVGDPGLPAVTGKETAADVTWRLNTQDSPVIPSRGLAARVRTTYIFDGPRIDPPLETARSSVGLLQLETNGSIFHRVRADDRLFFTWGFGTSFDKHPLVLQQYHLGQPFRLGAYDVGQLNGDHYYVGTIGYLYHVARLPDFLGGPIFAGGWLENGDAFNEWKDAGFKSQAGAGVVADTLLGAILIGGSAGFDGRWGWYLAIGRFFTW